MKNLNIPFKQLNRHLETFFECIQDELLFFIICGQFQKLDPKLVPERAQHSGGKMWHEMNPPYFSTPKYYSSTTTYYPITILYYKVLLREASMLSKSRQASKLSKPSQASQAKQVQVKQVEVKQVKSC